MAYIYAAYTVMLEVFIEKKILIFIKGQITFFDKVLKIQNI